VTDKPPFHERVAARLVAQLEAGTAPWQRPWQPGSSYVPTNAATGKSYRGINALLLLSQDRSDPRWLTYKQAEALDAQVRKGEHGALIQYWKFQEQVPQRDAQGSILRDEAGQALHSSVELERPRVFYAVVFNAQQIEGLPAPETKSRDWEPIARAEALLAKSEATIVHGGVRAFYSPARDLIRLPEQGQFETAASYYATALHELGHWTAHPTRLDRNIAHFFGSEEYAREELRAEIASLMLGDDIGVGHDPGQHAAHVGQWIAILKREPLEIFKAAAAAERIRDFVLGLEREQKLPASLQPTPDAPTQEASMKAAPERSGQRVYIDVPYAEREAARDLGARWDRALRSWYVPEGQEPRSASAHLPGSAVPGAPCGAGRRGALGSSGAFVVRRCRGPEGAHRAVATGTPTGGAAACDGPPRGACHRDAAPRARGVRRASRDGWAPASRSDRGR